MNIQRSAGHAAKVKETEENDATYSVQTSLQFDFQLNEAANGAVSITSRADSSSCADTVGAPKNTRKTIH